MASEAEQWKTADGFPKLAKWSSIPKSMILEPSDYAAYSLLQQLIDMRSRRAKLCAPILMNKSKIGRCLGRDEVRLGVSGFKGRDFPVQPEQKNFCAHCSSKSMEVAPMTDKERFDTAMHKILSVSKAELQRKLDAERAAKKAASRAPAASSRN
jgi:hypothetical protein